MFKNLNNTNGGHSKAITALAVLPNQNYLASGSEDSLIKIWDLNNFSKLKYTFGNVDGHNWTISSLISIANGGFLASSSWDSSVKVWNIN